MEISDIYGKLKELQPTSKDTSRCAFLLLSSWNPLMSWLCKIATNPLPFYLVSAALDLIHHLCSRYLVLPL